VADATLAANGSSVSATEGLASGTVVVATFTDANPGATLADFTATINWGDGTAPTAGTVTETNGVFSVAGSHTYADEGQFTVSTAISDDGGSKANPTSTVSVAEGDGLTPHALSFAATAGQSFSGTMATFSDSDLATAAGDFTATINWGDGTSSAGTVTGGNGTFTVSGTHNYSAGGIDAVTVSLADDAPGTASAMAHSTAEVAASTTPPVAVDDKANVLAGGIVTGNVLSNDSDPDGDSLTVSAVNGLHGSVGVPLAGTYGHLTLDANGNYSYSADNAAAIAAAPTGSHLHDIFSYTDSDGFGGTATASLDITLDRPPVATNDLAGVQLGATITGNVLTNDHDPDGDSIQVTGVIGGTLGQSLAGKYGSLVLASDGSYTYAENRNAVLPSQGAAQDSFTYTESDGHGGTAQATLNVSIVPNGTTYIAGTPGTPTAEGNGKGLIDGSLGNQTISGGNGGDVVIGGPNDTLSGGNGPDTFVFGPSSGSNTITDFDVHNDKIEFEQTSFASFADIQAHTQQVGPDTVITYHGTDTLTLLHVTGVNLQSSNFLLV
jgi:VCBS repeat-containing protein